MTELWQSLSTLQQVLVIIAVPSTLILVLQLILLLCGLGDEDGSFDGLDGDQINDFSVADIGGLRLFTLRGVLSFLAIGSWTALTVSTSAKAVWIPVVSGLAAGIAADVLLAVIMRSVRRLQQSGNIEIENAIGKQGEVYIPVPADRSGFGKVNVVLQGRLVELDAVTDSERMLKTGEEIVVTDVVGNAVVAEPKKD